MNLPMMEVPIAIHQLIIQLKKQSQSFKNIAKIIIRPYINITNIKN